MQLIGDFFAEIDRRWPRDPAGRVRLPIIGCGALMLQANYERGTKDSDVFETVDLTEAVKQHLVAIAGPGTDVHKRWKLYVDIVANGVPFLPHAPLWHPVPGLNQALVRLEIAVLDVVDVVVSKLKRFNANDQADIDAMVELDLVPHERLIDRFRAAVDEFLGDSREDQLPACVANLGVAESEIDLPSWI